MFAKLLPVLFFGLLLFSLPFSTQGQKKKKTTKPVADAPISIIHEQFRGNLLYTSDTIPTLLELDHWPRQDSGTFSMVQMVKEPGGRKVPYNTPGVWQMQTQQVNDEDVPAIVLNGKDAEFQLFFVRMGDSMLREVNASYQEMQPASVYTLHSITGSPGDSISAHDNVMLKLCGSYKGKMPCADCNSIATTLTLRFKKGAKYGDYTITDRYIGTPHGDITNETKGRWSYTSKLIEADHKSLIITLNPGKHPGESSYYVKKDGIVPIDNITNRTSGQTDKTLRKL